MQLWVDADACPRAIKEILYRAAERAEVSMTLIANRPLRLPESHFITMLQVANGFDVADKEIIKLVEAGDLVITSDIPLAAEVIEQGAYALNPRGELYTAANVTARLNMRDFMDSLRASDIHAGGPPALSASDKQAFANALDRFLTKHRA
jgi:hypothetical protein